MAMMYYTELNSPIGKIIIVSDGKNLTNLYFGEQNIKQNNFTKNLQKMKKDQDNLEIFRLVENWLLKYFNGENPAINFSLYLEGTNFQKNVWEILKLIPYGQTTTYGNIAKKIAKISEKSKMSAQAVGNAIGLNPIPIIVPCHRVIGANGRLVGYSGGIDIKIKLLEIENFMKPKVKN